MSIRHDVSLFVVAAFLCAALLGLAFEERIFVRAGSEDPAVAESTEPAGTDTLAGNWDTSYGPMTISVNSTSNDGQVEHVTGFWLQGRNTGLITAGTYYRSSGVFQFQFSEPWHGSTGTARFVLGAGGVFEGTWQFTGGSGRGNWSMQRPDPAASSNQPDLRPELDCPPAPPQEF